MSAGGLAADPRPTLVTGAGGFLGGHIARRLLAGGEAVRGLDLAWPEDTDALSDKVTATIRDDEAVEHAVVGCKAVIHCVGLAHLWQPDPNAYRQVNVEGTSHVLAAAGRHGARVVNVSSYTTLIGRRSEGVLDETTVLPPTEMLGPYPASKRHAELAVDQAVAAGLWACSVLPSAPVGASDHRLTPPSRMILDLALGRTPALLNCTLNLVDAAAVAASTIAARDRGRPGERYLLSGEDLSMPTVAAAVAALGGAPAPRPRVPFWVALAAAHVEAAVSGITKRPPTAPLTGVRLAGRPVRFDASKAGNALGFSPRPLAEPLGEALAWMQATGLISGG
ncbi:MAG: NAD-dependent epimerase/dehydratase family protein [Pseudomonadota bacterium]